MAKVVTIEKYINKVIHLEQAIKKLKCSERTFYRYLKKYKEHGPPGLRHGLTGKTSNNRKRSRDFLEVYVTQERFKGFGPTLLAEKLEEILGYSVPVETLRMRMIERGAWTPRKPRPPKRRPRKRKSGYGMMIQFDGSYHDWLGNNNEMCLLIGVDDATGDIVHAKFTKNESINDVIAYREGYFALHGKPSIIYLDRHASYKVNHPQDQFDKEVITRFQRAMSYLGIEVIFSKSPQGKGRVEKKFRLIQDRGIKEFRLAEIKTYEEAEHYLQNKLIPSRNKKFRATPELLGNFHVPLAMKDIKKLERYFAKRSKRVINNVGVVRYNNVKYVLDRGQTLSGNKKVIVLESHKGNIQIWSGTIQLSFKKL